MNSGDMSVYRDTVRFVLDGRVVELRDVDPNRTVLQFLREDLRLTGTKEGCAEGDCGACTVVIADVDEASGRLRARAINSCICFVPTLDGRELFTVESLAGHDLHPVQRAMITQHGSQCGFCTPGFVMSLFALYKTNPQPSRRDIDDALAGNLCRCTGYRPIISAATSMYREAPADNDWMSAPAGGEVGDDERCRMKRLRALGRDRPLAVEWQQRHFFSPRSLDELATLTEQYPRATVLAGGTDLALRVTKQSHEFDMLIYLGNIEELKSVGVTDTRLEIGAAVSLSDAMTLIVKHFPFLEALFLRFASPPIRNAATLGGNVANGSPIGDSMPALLALDAELVLRRGHSTRMVPLAGFYTGYRKTALLPGEIVERILIPLPTATEQIRSYKVSKRFDQDISAVCGAYRLRLAGDTIDEVRVAYGGMAEIPRRARHCEQALAGQAWTEPVVRSAMRALDLDFTPIDDMRATRDYRQEVCRNLLLRFFLQSTGAQADEVYTYGR